MNVVVKSVGMPQPQVWPLGHLFNISVALARCTGKGTCILKPILLIQHHLSIASVQLHFAHIFHFPSEAMSLVPIIEEIKMHRARNNLLIVLIDGSSQQLFAFTRVDSYWRPIVKILQNYNTWVFKPKFKCSQEGEESGRLMLKQRIWIYWGIKDKLGEFGMQTYRAIQREQNGSGSAKWRCVDFDGGQTSKINTRLRQIE